MIVLACDVGGTRIKCGLVASGRLLTQTEIPAEPASGLAAALERIAAERAGLLRAAGLPGTEPAALGLAFPGIIEPRTGRVLSTPAGKFDDAPRLDLSAHVRRLFGTAVVVDNDANAALAGEWQYGAARGCRSAVMMTLGTGVGTSVIIEGLPLRGPHGQAGCLGGHLLANAHGRSCSCGAVGCVETEASTWALPGLAQADPAYAASALAREGVIDYEAVFRLAGAGDLLAANLRDRSLQVWSAALVSLIHAYDPERVVLGGGIMRSEDAILPALRAYAAKHAWTPWGNVEIVPATLGNHAGILGMAWLAERGLPPASP